MRCCRATVGLIALALLPGTAARADEQPATAPTRDVDVTYRLAAANGGSMAEQRVRWEAATGRQRIDPPTPGLHIIVDPRAHRLASVRDAERLVLEIDSGAFEPLGGTAAHYVRRSAASVAGIACTVWQAGDAGGPELCFTGDGVLLRIAAGGNVVAEAVRVTYAPSNPDDFAVPPDYRRVTGDRPPAAPAPQESPK
jgi:hypothetical protein